MGIWIFCGIYVLELICYQLGLRLLFAVRMKASVWICAGFLIPVVVGIVPMDVAGKNVLITLGVIGVMFLSMEGRAVEKGFQLVLIVLLLVCLDDVLDYPNTNLLISNDNNYLENINYLKVKSYIVFSLCILNVLKGNRNKDKKPHINSGIYFILGIIVILMMLCLGILVQLVNFLPNTKVVILSNIIKFGIHVSIFLLILFVLYIKKTHEKMEQLLQTERFLKESQVKYYEQVLKKEIDTRKYRHDMVNHLTYVQDILSRNRIDDAQNYLNSILGRFKKIQSTYYVIGNDMVDTIMNYFFSMLPQSVVIQIIGRCPIELDIDDIDLCTIFSNSFQNAVEEILENNILDAKMIVKVKKGRQYVEYSIKNTSVMKINPEYINTNGLPKSHKTDQRNHGIGMLNTKETIEKNHGRFEWFQEDGFFCVNIVLPLKGYHLRRKITD